MVIFSYYLSRKYYPIPYDWKSIILYFGTGIGIYLFSVYTAPSSLTVKMALNTLYLITFVAFVLKRERIDMQRIKSLIKHT